jgi:hypothetical protein
MMNIRTVVPLAVRCDNANSTISVLVLYAGMAPPRNQRRREALADAAIAPPPTTSRPGTSC